MKTEKYVFWGKALQAARNFFLRRNKKASNAKVVPDQCFFFFLVDFMAIIHKKGLGFKQT